MMLYINIYIVLFHKLPIFVHVVVEIAHKLTVGLTYNEFCSDTIFQLYLKHNKADKVANVDNLM